MRHLRNIASFLLMAGSAYAFSFAADLLFGRFFSQFPDTVWVPIGTWLIISMFLAFFASLLSGSFIALVVPWVIFGVIALLGSVFGIHVHSYFVALSLFLAAAWRYRVNLRRGFPRAA